MEEKAGLINRKGTTSLSDYLFSLIYITACTSARLISNSFLTSSCKLPKLSATTRASSLLSASLIVVNVSRIGV
jgi:hypothetical protein